MFLPVLLLFRLYEVIHRPAVFVRASHHALVDRLLQPVGDAVADHARLGQDFELVVGHALPRHHDGTQPVGKPALAVQRDLVIVLVHHRLDVQAA